MKTDGSITYSENKTDIGCCPSGVCPPPTCSDGYRNGTEGDIDCGGPCAIACQVNDRCLKSTDCEGLAQCSGGRCALNLAMQLSLWDPQGRIWDMVNDPVSGHLYVSVDSTTGTDRVYAFAQGQVTPAWSVAINKPGALAVSDDGSTLYVATNEIAVVRVALATRTVGTPFSLGNDATYGDMRVAFMRVVPGDPNTLAVSGRFYNSTGAGNIHFYRNGVELFPGSTIQKWQTDYPNLIGAHLVFKDETTFYTHSSSRLVGSGTDLALAHVDDTGIHVESVQRHVMFGPSYDFHYAGGRLIGSNGQVVDPQTNTVTAWLDESRLANVVDYHGSSAVSADGSRYYPISRYSSLNAIGTLIGCYDTSTAIRTGGIMIPQEWTGGKPVGHELRIARWGTRGLTYYGTDLQSGNFVSKMAFLPDALRVLPGCEPYFTPPKQYPALPAASNAKADGTIKMRELSVRNLLTDPDSGAVYVALSSFDPWFPNSVVRFDPGQLTPTWATWVGAEPRAMALAAGSHELWVGFDGSTTFRKLNSLTGAPDVAVPIPANFQWGGVYAQAMDAMPGMSGTVFMTGYSRAIGLRVPMLRFDAGVERYGYLNDTYSQISLANLDAVALAVTSSGRLLASDDVNLTSVAVSDAALTATVLLGSQAFHKSWGEGGDYAVDFVGRVLDTRTGALTGMLDTGFADPLGITFSADGRIAYLMDDDLAHFSCHDLQTRSRKGSWTLNADQFPPGSRPIYQITRWGNAGFVMQVYGGVFFIPSAPSAFQNCH